VKTLEDREEPRLAPPGAGLPRAELMVARALFGLRRALHTRESVTRWFVRERERVRDLLGGLDAEAAARRVLIPRLRGLEDSSRHWSVWMTLDHLRIVHRNVEGVIRLLALGKAPPRAASTAAVKPRPDVEGRVVQEFEESCESLMATVRGVAELRTPARYAHPWFGPLDAFGWHLLSAVHLGLHRAQIARIKSALDSGGGRELRAER
jgi:hypothetical protein